MGRRTGYHEIGLGTRECALVQEPFDFGVGQGGLEVRVEAFLDEVLGEGGLCAVGGLDDVRHRKRERGTVCCRLRTMLAVSFYVGQRSPLAPTPRSERSK